MKILLIGSSGTLSKAVRNALLDTHQHEVIAIHRGHHTMEKHPHLQELMIDIYDDAKNTQLSQLDYDVVIDFIAYQKHDLEKRIQLLNKNIQQYIFISTVVALNHESTPIVDEHLKLGNPYSLYGQAKAECENYLRSLTDFPYTIIRPSQTYSEDRIPLSVKPKSCWPVVSRMMRNLPVIIHGDGQSLWSSMHAEDFAQALLGIIGNTETRYKAIHIQNGQSHTWDRVYQHLAKRLNVDYHPIYISSADLSHIKKYDFYGTIFADKRYSHIFKIEELLKYTPSYQTQIPLELGLDKFLEHMNQHPELKVEDADFDHFCDELVKLHQNYVESLENL